MTELRILNVNCESKSKHGPRISLDISAADIYLDETIEELENIVCQAKETLRARVAKQKTWDQKEGNPVVRQEPESSTHSNAQTSQEKEQSQRTTKTNDISEHYMPSTVSIGHTGKQYIVSHPEGFVTDAKGEMTSNQVIAESLIIKLKQGSDITIPNTWKVQVIDL